VRREQGRAGNLSHPLLSHHPSQERAAGGTSPGMGAGHWPVGQAGMVRLGGALAALEQNCESCDDGKT